VLRRHIEVRDVASAPRTCVYGLRGAAAAAVWGGLFPPGPTTPRSPRRRGAIDAGLDVSRVVGRTSGRRRPYLRRARRSSATPGRRRSRC